MDPSDPFTAVGPHGGDLFLVVDDEVLGARANRSRGQQTGFHGAGENKQDGCWSFTLFTTNTKPNVVSGLQDRETRLPGLPGFSTVGDHRVAN